MMLRHSKNYLRFIFVAELLARATAFVAAMFKVLFWFRYPIEDWPHFKIWINAVYSHKRTYHYLFWEKHMRHFYIKLHILRRELEDYNEEVTGFLKEDEKKKPVLAPRKPLTWRDTVL